MKTELDELLRSDFLSEVKGIIRQARTNAVRSVDFCRVQMYWSLGKRILEEEQDGKERADYGTYLLKKLSRELVPEFGSGFSYRQLAFCRQFYKTYPIVNALRSQFNWTQYRLLIQIDNLDKREYYELEAMNNCWTARELERQINSGLYERLLLSNDKEAVLSVARKERIPETPLEIIKDPMILEFLGLKREASYYEKDIEQALITHLQMYVNYYDREEKLPEENPTIGILLCANKNDTVVRYSLPKDNSTILASKYQIYLPSEEQLVKELKRELIERSLIENDRQGDIK
ncbi:PDDEXK nuclease domain-containing protein [Bacteroides oleiciplenus]|uniref:YhcG N-terminal domain-containing protein n=1 Tax=Bacteroides oleiciplenus YIT 12058 TaxID=742727 RepID=K9EP75_9BACE|nr:PDDEXK nuclease domain-containing protein [Bacteroides oleiciplenus]EKU90970.1 hypothetical protein HMPREF9447_02388 [Bacteroides oleiciplenus YIT 12058]